jgi:mevalonate kinase
VIQHLKLPLREILLLDAPTRVFKGPRQQRVFLAETPSRSAQVHDALAELRLAAERQPAVLRTMLEIISDLVGELDAADLGGRTSPLIEEAKLAVRMAEESGLPDPDLERILAAGRRLEIGGRPDRDGRG